MRLAPPPDGWDAALEIGPAAGAGHPDAQAPVLFRGIDPATLARALFLSAEGEGLAAQERSIVVGLEGDPHEPSGEPDQAADVLHGRIELRAGQPTVVQIDPAAGGSEAKPGPSRPTYPESLVSALNQQWARAGGLALHAATFAWDDHGVLVIGDSGSGKSTLCAVAERSGATVATDDWTLLRADNNSLQAIPLRPGINLRPGWARDQLEQVKSSNGAANAEPTPISIHQLVFLSPPSTHRPERTEAEALPPAITLTRLIQQSAPILHSTTFPTESTTARQVTTQALALPNTHLITGKDLVKHPTNLRHLLGI